MLLLVAIFGSIVMLQPGHIDICGCFCYHQRTCKYFWSVLLSESMLMSMDQAVTDLISVCAQVALGAMLISMACAAAKGYNGVHGLYVGKGSC